MTLKEEHPELYARVTRRLQGLISFYCSVIMTAEDAALSFYGDGSHPADGGSALQHLWDMPWRWRELRGCPGRYVSSDKELRRMSPQAVLEALPIRCSLALPQRLRRYNVPGKDSIDVARLPGGGAIITYVKQEHHSRSSDAASGSAPATVFVHTLNTESGLLRKAEALDLPVSDIFRIESSSSTSSLSSSSSSSSSAAAVVAMTAARVSAVCIVHTLTFLIDAEKNASAYTLVRWFRKRSIRIRPG